MDLRFVVLVVILHKIPYDGDSRPEAIKQRKRLGYFVKRKRAK